MPFDFSLDLDMGRRPELKFDEKSKGIPIVLDISGCEQVFTAEKVLYLFEASVLAAGTVDSNGGVVLVTTYLLSRGTHSGFGGGLEGPHAIASLERHALPLDLTG